MAKSNKSYIDVDRTVLEPSLQRVRNILTLEERVRAIQAYDCRPMYTKVAKMFNCSWEQIKNIIANRDAIMKFYYATKNTDMQSDPDLDEIRQRKIKFLGECMYEYIQRAQFHAKVDVSEELLRTKALEFRDIIRIHNFTPNKVWINHFKATYNFSLSNRQITLTRTPPASLELKDIMTYCTTNKTKVECNQTVSQVKNLYRTSTKIACQNANMDTVEELKRRRQRKIKFLEKALHEYWQRSTYHTKMQMHETSVRKIAFELKEMLKIENFYPNKEWLNKFLTVTVPTLNKQLTPRSTRPPPLSLDLKDILSYCSRLDNKVAPSTVTLTPKEPGRPVRSVSTVLNGTKAVDLKSTQAPAAVAENTPATAAAPGPVAQPLVCIHTFDLHRNEKPQPKIKQEVIDLDVDELPDVKPNVNELTPLPSEQQGECNDTSGPPPLKIRKIESITETEEQPVHSPGHWSEHSDKDEEELPKHVHSYADALRLLKPLEEFAMLEENYRVIGLITQLEEIFKNPPDKGDES